MKNIPSAFPYPLISSFTEDFAQGVFDVDFEFNVDRINAPIVIECLVDLTNESLAQLIATNQVSVYVDLVAPSVFYRTQFKIQKLQLNSSLLIQNYKFELTLPAGSLVGNVELTGYLVSESEMDYSPEGLHPDYGNAIFKIYPGDVLGVSATRSVEIGLDFGASPDLVTMKLSKDLDPNVYLIETDGNIIQVLLGQNYMDYWSITSKDKIATSQLWQGLYKDIMVAGLSALVSMGTENVEVLWARRLLNALVSEGISIPTLSDFNELNKIALARVGADGVQKTLRRLREI